MPGDVCAGCGGDFASLLHHEHMRDLGVGPMPGRNLYRLSSPAPVPSRAKLNRPDHRSLHLTGAGAKHVTGCVGGWPRPCFEYVRASRFAWCAPCLVRHPRAKQTAGA